MQNLKYIALFKIYFEWLKSRLDVDKLVHINNGIRAPTRCCVSVYVAKLHLASVLIFPTLPRYIFSPIKRDELSLDFLYKAPNIREIILRCGLRVET